MAKYVIALMFLFLVTCSPERDIQVHRVHWVLKKIDQHRDLYYLTWYCSQYDIEVVEILRYPPREKEGDQMYGFLK